MNIDFRKLLIVGQSQDKINFIKEFLFQSSAMKFEEICRKKEDIFIELRHYSSYECKIECNSEDTVKIFSFWFPAGIILKADINIGKRWIDSFTVDSCDMVLFLCSYPWKTEELLDNLHMIPEHLYKNISCQPIQYSVIRWVDNQRFGATDIINPEKVISELPIDICKNLEQSFNTQFIVSILEYPIYSSRHDFFKVISTSGKTFTVLTEESKKRFEKWQQMIIDFPSKYFCEHPDYLGLYACNLPFEMWDGFEKIQSPKAFKKVTLFESVNGCRDIMQQFKNKYYQCYNKTIFNVVDEIYKENVKEICFWDLEQDILQLHLEIEKKYYEILKHIKKVPCPNTKREYQTILHKNKYDITFNKKIKEFLQSDMMHIIYEHIIKKQTILKPFI